MARISEQVEWLNLIDRSGPFVVPAVLEDIFPQGFEKVDTPGRQRLRAAYDEWRDAVDDGDPDLADLHGAWIRMVLQDALEFEEEVFVRGQDLETPVTYRAAEHSVEIIPDFVFCGEDDTPRLLMAIYPPGCDLEKPLQGMRWSASAAERMTLLCRANACRVGLVTNGEQWMLVNAPIGGTSGYASWFARLWWQEPVTFRAFVSLLGVRRFFGPLEETIGQLLERSLLFQGEITDTLGEQVRHAIEVLIQALARADEDRNGELLADVGPAELYEAGLTTMMRLVFILCAEERGLLLLGEPIYDQHYAISTLRAKLREDESQHGPEVLERRHDAWCRLLSVFRAVYGGIEHNALRMPSLGGSLFDPDRFPFLEGRLKSTSWREEASAPLPIDNRTVLLLLTALQVLDQQSGAQLMSYRALDIEQIGHVYEGLLDYTAIRLPEVTLDLIGSSKVPHPIISLRALEAFTAIGTEVVIEQLSEVTGRSRASIAKALSRGRDNEHFGGLIQACGGDESLARRIKHFAALIRTDSWGVPLIYRAGSFAIGRGDDRRETGTHYTPRRLTETIVEMALEPLVYTGPLEGKVRDDWTLRTTDELLDLKICDPAMGSGAFLVQVCRYLSERLVESWTHVEEVGGVVNVDGRTCATLDKVEPLPRDPADRLLIARRLVAERCLYGADLNPLAVELAKLSIWLVTLAKGRPFGFLDHNLRCGDSLLGIHGLEQLVRMDIAPAAGAYQQRLFGRSIKVEIDEASKLRRRLREIPIRDIRDVRAMATLDAKSRHAVDSVRLLADAFIGEVLQSRGDKRRIEMAFRDLAMAADRLFAGDKEAEYPLKRIAGDGSGAGLPTDVQPRKPFHWPLEFPEVFERTDSGFDAVVGNPPWASYSGRQAVPLNEVDGDYFSLTYKVFKGWKSLHSMFVERILALVRKEGTLGILLPAQVADLDGYQSVRAAVRRAHALREPLPYFGESAFVGVVQPAFALIAVGSPRRTSGDLGSSPFLLGEQARQTQDTRLQADGRSLSAIVEHLEKWSRAPAEAFADPGIHTGNCSKKLVLEAPIGECAPVREGKNIHAYRLEPAEKWVRLDYAPAPGEYFTIRLKEVYVQVPILLRQTAARPIAVPHTSPTYFRNSVLACRGITGVPIEAVVAWLNSSAAALFHVIGVREANQKAFPQVKVKHLRNLPMPRWTPELLSMATELFPKAAQGDKEAQCGLDCAVSRAFGLSDEQHAVLTLELNALLAK